MCTCVRSTCYMLNSKKACGNLCIVLVKWNKVVEKSVPGGKCDLNRN